MSALPQEADIRQRIEHVCFVPKTGSNRIFFLYANTAAPNLTLALSLVF